MPVYASAFKEARPPVAVIGAGAMGRALALRLVERGYPLRAVLSQTRAHAEELARSAGAGIASDDFSQLPDDVCLVVIAVTDAALVNVAELLTGMAHPWRETVVMHTSGALSAAALEPLAKEGAATASFHPLQAVTPSSGSDVLDHAYVGLEGDDRAVAAGIELAVGLGMRYIVLSSDAKARYHLAATMASNFFVTLMGMVQEVLASLDINREDGFAMMEPLLRGTLDSLASASPEEALTGPVARGDLETLRMHGQALREHLPQLVPAYAALTVEAVRLAVRSGKLDPERAEEVLGLMVRLVTTPHTVGAADSAHINN